MIATKDADNICRLLKKLARDSSTENTIAFLADNAGMLHSCRNVLALCQEGNEETGAWLQKKCSEIGVQYLYFIQESAKILQLFEPNSEKNDSYAVLGLERFAGLADIKRAYRRLSVQYHPDTAGNKDRDTTERFIQINQAYHELTTTRNLNPVDAVSAISSPIWRYGKSKKRSKGINRKALLWGTLLVLASIVACILIAQIYSQKVMISTLHQSGAAFVPPVKKTAESLPAPAMTFAEKIKIAQTREKAERAAMLRESGMTAGKSATHAVEPEKNVIKAAPAAHAGLEKEAVVPAKETARMIPTDTDSPNIKDSQATKETTKLEAGEAKVETATVEAAKKGQGAKENTIAATTKEAISPGIGKQELGQIHMMPVEHRAQHGMQTGTVPEVDARKNEGTQEAIAAGQTKPREALSGVQMQQRIDAFLGQYCKAYGTKNLEEFSRLFAPDATENGKPIADLMATYTNLFAATKTIALQISSRKWQQGENGQINLNGYFNIDLVYLDAEVVHGRGTIDFRLSDERGDFHIQTMSYSFDQ